MQTRRIRGPRWLPLLLLLPLLSACGADLQADLEDSERTRAIEVPLGRVVVDYLAPNAGDTHDWKYVTIPSEGLVTITVGFDKEWVKPGVRVTNEVGQVLSDLELPDSSSQLRRLSFQAEPQNYYIQAFAKEGGTDYSVEVLFEPRVAP